MANPRSAAVEESNAIVWHAVAALEPFTREHTFLNPDCGSGCFANRWVNDEEAPTAKLRNTVRAAWMLRERYG